MSHKGKLRDDLKLLGTIQDLLHSLPQLQPKKTKSALDSIAQLGHSSALSELEKGVRRSMERLYYLHCITRYDDEDKWDTEWLPLALAVCVWKADDYENGWSLLDEFLNDLRSRVARLHRTGELPKANWQSETGHTTVPVEFTELDEKILKALGDKELMGKQIALKMRLKRLEDPIKKRLAHLRKNGTLKNRKGHGYSRVLPE